MEKLNTTVFFISLAIGTIISLAVAWRYSRSGSHPRFRPKLGLVLIVFLSLMAANAILSLFIARMIGTVTPPVNLEEKTPTHLKD